MGRTKDPLQLTRNGKPIDLEGLWSPNPAFLVGSGPSLLLRDLNRLRERGVASLAVNNAAAVAPVRAWTFSDPQSKFHQGVFLDPTMLTFCPKPKLGRKIVAKVNGEFHSTGVEVRSCPNVYGFERMSQFVPETFFDTPHAHWGAGKHQPKSRPLDGSLCTIFLGFRLLYYLGARRIFLLGVDHRKTEDGFAYGYPTEKRYRKGFWKERLMWRELLPEMDRRGIEVFDAGGLCYLFPSTTFDDAVEQCKGGVPLEPFDTVGWNDKKRVAEQIRTHKIWKPRWH